MGVHYIVPDAEYQMNRYNRHCCKLSRSDFFNPAFDKLGLQPLYRGEVILSKLIIKPLSACKLDIWNTNHVKMKYTVIFNVDVHFKHGAFSSKY